MTEATNQRPNATGLSSSTSGSLPDRLNGYIDKAAFSAAPQFTFGNVSRTLGTRGPGQANWDISIFTFQITEKGRAQFRAEALNAANTPQSQANFPRLIQLRVRFTF